MSKKTVLIILLSVMTVLSLQAGNDLIITYEPNSTANMKLDEIPDMPGYSGFLLGTFFVKASNNPAITMMFSRPDNYSRFIFSGTVDGVYQENIEFRLFYTWDGNRGLEGSFYTNDSGARIVINQKKDQWCHMNVYIAIDKPISSLNGVYRLTSNGGKLPQITVNTITANKNFDLSVNGINQGNGQGASVDLINSTPTVNTGAGNSVPGVSTDGGSSVLPTVPPVIHVYFYEPGKTDTIDTSTKNLDYQAILSNPVNVPVTDIRIGINYYDGQPADAGYDITVKSNGYLYDQTNGNMIPYNLHTYKGSVSGIILSDPVTVSGNEDTYSLSTKRNSGYGTINVSFNFPDTAKLMNAVAGTYTDTVTVTVTNTY